jgi:hypothetical protein
MIAVLDRAPETARVAAPPVEASAVPNACPECLAPFVARSWQQLFCCPAHKRLYNNRWLKRGAVLAPIAAAARATRNGTRGNKLVGTRASTDSNRLLERWKEEDERAGRMPVVDYMALRYRYDLVETC